ncbi:DNA translocase FtsK [Parabacteroides provencensis]|uniref:DNA translocase FtsK n=1 Tax=Parabacteroides provencensis TaxID=1944636 RepID=UPI000C14B47C|nr:DNA translocase FtsK [Parabacteroides provencensis]
MNKYSSYSDAELEELFSYYLIDSWSYSKVASFSRNEKEFEKTYIYREKSRISASTVAGNAYHVALELFFNQLKDGVETSLAEMEQIAFTYIDNIPVNVWKTQKTTPTIEECNLKATKVCTSLLKNFYSEKSIYMSGMSEILGVELRCDEWLVINGVDIPLPCHANIDLVLRLDNGKVVIVDHKSKSKFTDDDELVLVCGKQAITYILNFESKTGIKVDEVWFIENKDSKNKDNSPQLKKFKIILDNDTRKLYEALLYEPLKRMIEAVSDPDYIYMINDNDNFIDRAELYDFWAKTMIAEVDDFNIPDKKKELISRRQKKIRDASIGNISPKTITSFRDNAASFITYDLSNTNMTNGEKIEHALRTFGVIVKVAHEISGYSSNTFLLEVSAGVKISNVMKYRLDIANALDVSSVRIGNDLMVYNDKSYLFIETSKKRTDTLYWDKKYLVEEKIPIGVDNFGRTVVWDMNNHSTPHVLICGATGSGKSVSIISTLKYAKAAKIKNIYIFDPKYEFCSYSGYAKVFNEIEDIEEQMRLLVVDMQKRAKTGRCTKTLIIFDEFADAVASAKSGPELDIKEEVVVGVSARGIPKKELKTVGRLKSLEENLKILLQKGRSLGFRIVAATQRASVNVITGDAKVNFPVQICFRVPKEIDSKVVIDEAGAETLSGMGDGLMKSPEYLNVVRFQGFYYKQ